MKRNRKHKRRRGISFGTILMLVLTIVIGGGCLILFPRLQGNTELHVDTSQMLSDLTLNGSMPQLSLSDIPITVTTADPAKAAATPIPTMQPEVQQLLSTSTPSVQTATLTFGGSINVESGIRKSGYFSETKTYDFDDVMSLLAPEMQTDLCVVPFMNLIATNGKYTDLLTTEAALSLFTTSGVDVVPLGFPTAFDQGTDGLTATLDAIRARGLTPVGANASAEEAAAPRILTVGGLRISILHYVDALSSTGRKRMKKEAADYALPVAEAETIAADIACARSAGAQVVIVSLSWGDVGKTSPTKDQQMLAQAIADSGADVIVGTGTKVVQPIVWLTGTQADGSTKQVLCAYNLGTLISDSRKKTAYVGGMLLQLQITCDNAGAVSFEKLEYTPTYIWRYKQGSQYLYRVLASDSTPPDAMSDEQRSVMQKALATVQNALKDSVVTQRTK